MEISKKFFILILGCLPVFTLLYPCLTYSYDYQYQRDKWGDWTDTLKELPSISDPYQSAKWRRFFGHWSYEGRAVQDAGFRFILDKFLFDYDGKTKTDVIRGLQNIRSDLPYEIRWLLAAEEADNSMVTPESAQDAQSAILHTLLHKVRTTNEILDTDAFDSGTLIYSDPDSRPDRDGMITVNLTETGSVSNLLFLFSRWHYLAAAGAGPEASRLSSKRLDWLRAISQISPRRFNVGDMRKLFDTMDSPAYLGLGTPIESSMIVAVWIIVLNLRNEYAITEQNDKKVVRETYGSYYKNDMDHILGLLKKWTIGNIPFLLRNYQNLSEAGVISLSDLFSRQPTTDDTSQLERIIGSRSLKTTNLESQAMEKADATCDSYFVAFVLMAYQNQHTTLFQTNKTIDNRILDILTKAENYRQGVMLTADGLDKIWMSAADFNFLLKTFYQVHTVRKLPQDFAEELLKHDTHRTPDLSDQDWQGLERLRLEAVETALPPAQFKEELILQVLGSTGKGMHDRLLAAEYLRTKMKVDDLDAISLRLKIHEEGVKPSSYKEVSEKTWTRNDGNFISLLMALNPTDLDLRNYLSDVFVKKQVDGPVGPRDALSKLVEIGFAPDWLKTELIRRLKYVESGDSLGHFNALLDLFPNEGLAIAEVIFAHRKQLDKFKILMTALVEHAKKNPSLVESIRNGLKTSANSEAATALYQQVTLDKWLEQKIAPPITGTVMGPSCPTDLAKLSQVAGAKQ